MDFSSVSKQLTEKSYISVPFNVSRKSIDEAVEAFFQFLNLSNEIKSHINFTIAPNHRRGEVGFVHRSPEDDAYRDSKDFFHFHPAVFSRYPKFLQEQPIVNEFMEKAMPIWSYAYKTTFDLLKIFEQQYPDSVTKIFDAKEPHIILRFLKYDWSESGKYVAKPHFDAGSFTLAIAESKDGLRIGDSPDNLISVNHKDKRAIFMLSSNFKKVINSDVFKPAWHDVIQVENKYIGKPYARWAVVAFIEADGVEALSREETHKWYNEEVGS